MITLKVKTAELFRTEYDMILPNGKTVMMGRKPTEKDFLLALAKSDISVKADFGTHELKVNERTLTTGYGNFIAAEIQKLDAAKIDYVIEWEGEEEEKKKKKTERYNDVVIPPGMFNGLSAAKGIRA